MLIFFSWWCVPSRHVSNIRVKFEHKSFGLFICFLYQPLCKRKCCKEQIINTFILFVDFFNTAFVFEDPDLSPKRSVGFRQKYSSVSLWRELVEPVMPALLADPSPSLPLKIPLKAFSRHQPAKVQNMHSDLNLSHIFYL